MISVVVPVYNMGNAEFFLKRNLDSLRKQTYKDFDVIVTDNSPDHLIERICDNYKGLNLYYKRNPRKGMAQNTNEGIKLATGDLIKILYQDDYLAHEHVLKDIIDVFTGHWLCMGADDNPKPYWTDDIETGNNKLGSPSALTIKNDNPMLFDENLGYALDCDYYKRMHEKYGEPVILEGVCVNMGIGEHQATQILSKAVKDGEFEYLIKKYE